MKLRGFYRALVVLVILAVNVGCDQVTKSMMRRHITVFDHYSFFNGHVTLLNVENTGAFLSLGDNLPNPFRFILLTMLPVLALLAGLSYVIAKKNITKLSLVGIVFVIGGGMGNIYDRIVHGSVTDFMHLRFGVFQTGVFNAADVSIMIGAGLVLLDTLINKKAQHNAPTVHG
jgi:signal peptidase II